MRLEFKVRSVAGAFRQLAGLVKGAVSIPILEHLLIQAQDGHIIATASDLTTTLQLRLDVQTDVNGAVTLPARKVAGILKSLPGDAHVKIETSGEQATMVSGRSRFRLASLPAADYPLPNRGREEQAIDVDAPLLRELLERAQHAMAANDVRYYLNGILLKASDGRLEAVATDGHRLARMRAAIESKHAAFAVILPREAIKPILRIADGEGGVSISVCAGHAQVSNARAVCITKLIDGQYPDYQRLLTERAQTLTVGLAALVPSVRRVALCAGEQGGMRVDVRQDALKLSCVASPTRDEAEDWVACRADQEVFVGLNAAYLLDALSAVRSETAVIQYATGNDSIYVLDAEDERFTGVVMPMRM